MPTQNDPKELKGFSSMDDRPDNNGNYLDEERLVPPRYASSDEDFLDDGEDEDDWAIGDFGERFD